MTESPRSPGAGCTEISCGAAGGSVQGRGGMVRAAVIGLAVVLLLATSAAANGPRYDVPRGFDKCPAAEAWNGFFKWASVRRTTCRHATRFMSAYAEKARAGSMPRRMRGFRCRIRYWRNRDGDIYASRHRCSRRDVVIRFHGMA
jgi:hypothetical protein